MNENPTPNLCECGCGEPAPLASKTMTARGWVRGEPLRFIHGHSGGRTGAPWGASLWRIEDRGYETACWIWLCSKDAAGYGRINRGGERAAHRLAWRLLHGPIPDGLELDHLCGQRSCVNPEHLEAVTHLENVRRGRGMRLSESIVQTIRSSHDESAAALARRFRVTPGAVLAIRHGRTWKEVGLIDG